MVDAVTSTMDHTATSLARPHLAGKAIRLKAVAEMNAPSRARNPAGSSAAGFARPGSGGVRSSKRIAARRQSCSAQLQEQVASEEVFSSVEVRPVARNSWYCSSTEDDRCRDRDQDDGPAWWEMPQHQAGRVAHPPVANNLPQPRHGRHGPYSSRTIQRQRRRRYPVYSARPVRRVTCRHRGCAERS